MPRLLVLVALCVGSAAAQPAPPATPFLEIGGDVRIDTLTVVRAGTVSIRLFGDDPVREDVRDNLPAAPRDGETYRDVRYRFRLAVSPLLRGVLPADSLLASPPRRRPSPSPR